MSDPAIQHNSVLNVLCDHFLGVFVRACYDLLLLLCQFDPSEELVPINQALQLDLVDVWAELVIGVEGQVRDKLFDLLFGEVAQVLLYILVASDDVVVDSFTRI